LLSNIFILEDRNWLPYYRPYSFASPGFPDFAQTDPVRICW